MKKYFSLLPVILLYLLATFQPLQAQTTKTQKVYITRTGEKYHTSSCRYLKQSKEEVDLKEVVKSYDPCKVCKPAKLNSENTTPAVKEGSVEPKPKPKSNTPRTTSSVQCSGTTKAGNRCKRKTTAANGRCYQH